MFCCCRGVASLRLSDDAVGEGGGPAQPLALHLEPTAFVVGHAPAVHLQVGLKKLPDPLLGLQLSVGVTCTQTNTGEFSCFWRRPLNIRLTASSTLLDLPLKKTPLRK